MNLILDLFEMCLFKNKNEKKKYYFAFFNVCLVKFENNFVTGQKIKSDLQTIRKMPIESNFVFHVFLFKIILFD